MQLISLCEHVFGNSRAVYFSLPRALRPSRRWAVVVHLRRP